MERIVEGQDLSFETIAKRFEGSKLTKYGKDQLEFDLHLNGPTQGKFRITGTVDQVKKSLAIILDRFGPKE